MLGHFLIFVNFCQECARADSVLGAMCIQRLNVDPYRAFSLDLLKDHPVTSSLLFRWCVAPGFRQFLAGRSSSLSGLHVDQNRRHPNRFGEF